MNDLTIKYNGQDYIAKYNKQTQYYELELKAQDTGGIYNTAIAFTDIFGDTYNDNIPIQIFAKEKPKIESNKVFMWIWDYQNFELKDIVELTSYEINIDEETNATTILNVAKKTSAKARDIIAIKQNNEVVFWGIIDNIQNEDGNLTYEYICKYITNMFNQNIKLEHEDIIRISGLENFIARAIRDNFINNADTLINKKYIQLRILTNTPKEARVTNVENNIYNLHTWMTNCTQNYDIVYSFSIVNKKLVITIENKTTNKELIDINAQSISNYSEVFETDVVSKVIVLYSKINDIENEGQYVLYLKNDRTTTTNMNDPNRAEGKIETVYTENYEDANQEALNIMKSNSYNHNITFKLNKKYIKVGTPIAIKTKESIILDTYISAVKITNEKFFEYTCGNIRTKFIDKLLKERNG